MPNPMEQQTDEREALGGEGGIAAAEHPTESGPANPRDSSTRGAAGDVKAHPRQLSTDEAILLLTATVAEFERAGRTTAAAGVSASMHKVEPGFSPKRSAFGSFRQLLEEAQRRGVIEIHRGANDFILHSTVTAPPTSTIDRPERLREDLWSALLDWRETARYSFNRVTRGTSPSDGALGAGDVLVPTVQRTQHVEWMRDFAESQGSESVRTALLEALGTDDPARGFASAIRRFDAAGRRWKRTLRQLVLDRAARWATEHRIPASDLEPDSSIGMPHHAVGAESLRGVRTAGDAEALRREILAVLQTMPLHELMRLPVPLEYALHR